MKSDLFYATATQLEEARSAMKLDGFSLHHSSLARGYIKKDAGFYTQYSGKFGHGYVIHWPNAHNSDSNQYHVVEYFVKS